MKIGSLNTNTMFMKDSLFIHQETHIKSKGPQKKNISEEKDLNRDATTMSF